MKFAVRLVAVAAAASICLCTSSVFAQQEDEQATKYFTIDEAVEWAKENSLDLASKKEKEISENYNAEAARMTKKTTKKQLANTGLSSITTYLITSGYAYEGAKVTWATAKRDVLSTEYEIESKVKQAYYTCVSQKDKTALAQESLDSARERLSYAETKLQSGMIAQMDVTSFELAVLKAQNDLETQKRALEYDYLNLKSIINYPLEDSIEVSGGFERVEMDETSIEEARDLMKTSINRANIDDGEYIAKLKHDTYTAWYTYGQYEYHAAKYEYLSAEDDYQNSLNALETGLVSAYNAMKEAYEGLDYLDETLKYTESQVQAAKLRYEMGMITADDYNTAVQNCESTKNSLADTELGAYMAVEGYRSIFRYTNTISREDIAK